MLMLGIDHVPGGCNLGTYSLAAWRLGQFGDGVMLIGFVFGGSLVLWGVIGAWGSCLHLAAVLLSLVHYFTYFVSAVGWVYTKDTIPPVDRRHAFVFGGWPHDREKKGVGALGERNLE
jgi:hypothetical protein